MRAGRLSAPNDIRGAAPLLANRSNQRGSDLPEILRRGALGNGWPARADPREKMHPRSGLDECNNRRVSRSRTKGRKADESDPNHDDDFDEQAEVIPRRDHPLSRQQISPGALKVLYRLHRAGFEAQVVGGGVRDLLLGLRPKDFDIVTDARPERVKRLFRNSRIIGRRFRLVHVVFRDELVEVATFRKDPDPRHQKRTKGRLVTSDNTYGTPRQDAFRRDFTVNALFYRIRDYAIVDYVGGLDDLEDEVIRVIGNPKVRYEEDPVRMLRACEFAGRLGFRIERGTLEGIRRHRLEIRKAAPARMVEEILGILASGHADPTLDWMNHSGLLEILLPEAKPIFDDPEAHPFGRIFEVLDDWVEEQRSPSESLVLAALLVPRLIETRAEVEAEGSFVRRTRLQQMVEKALLHVGSRFTLSNARRTRAYHTLETFQRLCEPVPDKPGLRNALVARPAFPEALQLFELVVQSTGGGHEQLAAWQELEAEAPKRSKARRRSRPRRRR